MAYDAGANEYVVAYEYEYSVSDHDLYRRRVAANGSLPDGESAVSAGGNWEGTPDLAAGSSGVYPVVWEDNRNNIAAPTPNYMVLDIYVDTVSVPTITPTPSSTPTRTPTSTGTRTPTPTNTGTATPTRTATPTNTGTPTPTNTGTVTPTHTGTPTPTNTGTPTATGTPTQTPTITPTSTPIGPAGDAFEPDNSCAAAREIAVTGVPQGHNFHVAGDEDWVAFAGLAGKSYIIVLNNVGASADAVITLYDSCAQAPVQQGYNAFGPTVEMQWTATAPITYYLHLMQNDPAVYGAEATYQVSVRVDNTPPSEPKNIRIAAGDQKLFIQWRKPPEADVAGYRLQAQANPPDGTDCDHPGITDDAVAGADNTFYELTGLSNGTWYCVRILAKDASGNVSVPSTDTWGQPSDVADWYYPGVESVPAHCRRHLHDVGSRHHRGRRRHRRREQPEPRPRA